MPPLTPNNSPSLLAVGPWDRGEFAALRDELDPERRWPNTPLLAEALDAAAKLETPPELILLAQPRPGVDDQAEIERWRTASPLTRIVVIAGAWCAGELRTARPLTGVIRLYWHDLPSWWRQSLALFASGEAPPWSAPLTATSGSSATAGSSSSEPQVHAHRSDHPLLAIDSLDYATFEAIEHTLKPTGWQSIWQPRHRPELWTHAHDIHPAAGIWDGGQLDDQERGSLHQFCARLPATPVIALVDFPRPEHIGAAKSCGAAAILGKPYATAALLNELNRLTNLRPSASICG